MSALLREYHRRHDDRDWAGLASLFRLDGEFAIHGDANLRISLRGPNGRAKAHVTAELTAGKWSLDPVDVEDLR